MTYSEALVLDQILRTVDLPPKYYPTAAELEVPTPGRRLREWNLTTLRPLGKIFCHLCSFAERIVPPGFLLIHRTFFISALMEYPHNPMLSPYHKSLSVTICCCSFLIRSFAVYFEPWIEPFSRFWPKFTHVFSAAVILGSFAIRSPFLAPGYILEDLELTVGLYKKAAPYAPRARIALVRPCLKILSDRANFLVAVLDKITRKGEMVNWNRTITTAPQLAGGRIRIS